MSKLLLLVALLAMSCSSAPERVSTAHPTATQVDFEHWCTERDRSLRSPTGYLTLAGLLWLDDGRHSLGGGPDSDLRLPGGRAPDHVGQVQVNGERVVIEAAAGVTLRVDEIEHERIELASDSAGKATVVRVGEVSFWLIERAGALGLRVRDPASPVLAAFDGVETFDFDAGWAVAARFEPSGGETLSMPNVLGSSYEDESPGSVVFELAGRTQRLLCTGDPEERLFIVFGDETNGQSTYGGGRFLAVAAPDSDGWVTLDFNRAYNPPCALSPYTTCPLPPAGNKLALPVTAGERAPSRSH